MEKEKCVYCEEGKEKLLPIDYSNTDFGFPVILQQQTVLVD